MLLCDAEVKNTKKKPQRGKAKNTREAALNIVHALFQHPEDGTPLPVMLMCAVRSAELDERNASMLSELVYGVLRHYALLDAALNSCLSRQKALSLQIRCLLRIGAFEIFCLDSVPCHATVNELAGIARRRFGIRSAGFINAVLRSLARDAETFGGIAAAFRQQEEAHGEGVPLRMLSEECSLPEWLLALWEEQYGRKNAACFARRTGAAPRACWRVNMAREGGRELLSEWIAKGYSPVGESGFSADGADKKCLEAKYTFNTLELLEKKGCISRQGMASLLIGEDIASRIREHSAFAGAPLWDACCGRGGKTVSLLEKGVNVALASDPSAFRLEEMRNELRRLDLRPPQIRCSAAQHVDAEFPLILMDAPCSGTGTLGRNAELRLRITPARLAAAARLQEELLHAVYPKLLPGGMLFYITCALNKEENERQTARFLQCFSGKMHLEQERMYMPDFAGQDVLYMAVFRKF